MTEFRTFQDFKDHLLTSIYTGKDIYVYNFNISDDSDYQFEKEDDILHYYVNHFIDINELHKTLFYGSINGNLKSVEDLKICFDYYDDEGYPVKRLFIFRSK